MKTPPEISRRDFFKISLAGAGLAIGFSSSGCTDQGTPKHETAGFSPSVYLKITPDNEVTIMVTEAEMGQGVWTSLPMLIAEELDIDLAAVQVEQAPLLPGFRNNITWGSTSIRKSWVPLRMAGAIAREMLITAAAGNWLVPASECAARTGWYLPVNVPPAMVLLFMSRPAGNSAMVTLPSLLPICRFLTKSR